MCAFSRWRAVVRVASETRKQVLNSSIHRAISTFTRRKHAWCPASDRTRPFRVNIADYFFMAAILSSIIFSSLRPSTVPKRSSTIVEPNWRCDPIRKTHQQRRRECRPTASLLPSGPLHSRVTVRQKQLSQQLHPAADKPLNIQRKERSSRWIGASLAFSPGVSLRGTGSVLFLSSSRNCNPAQAHWSTHRMTAEGNSRWVRW